eukprot:COSAG02_NODE_9929_length_2071_cov_2.794118_3_plen_87_part_00
MASQLSARVDVLLVTAQANGGYIVPGFENSLVTRGIRPYAPCQEGMWNSTDFAVSGTARGSGDRKVSSTNSYPPVLRGCKIPHSWS